MSVLSLSPPPLRRKKRNNTMVESGAAAIAQLLISRTAPGPYRHMICLFLVDFAHSGISMATPGKRYILVVSPLMSLKVAVIYMQESLPHKRLLVGCSSPYMRLAPTPRSA